MKLIDLDLYGEQFFKDYAPAKIGGKNIPYRFNLRGRTYHCYSNDFISRREKTPFIWSQRLRDWRRLEKVYARTNREADEAWKEMFEFLDVLMKRTVKICGKQVHRFYLQVLDHSGKNRKKTVTSVDYFSSEKTVGTEQLKFVNPSDANFPCIWFGSPEEVEYNRLRRRAEQLRQRNNLAETAFNEAVRIRLQDWWKKMRDQDLVGSYRSTFATIRVEDRSYGFIIGAGKFESAWTPTDLQPNFA